MYIQKTYCVLVLYFPLKSTLVLKTTVGKEDSNNKTKEDKFLKVILILIFKKLEAKGNSGFK